MVGTSDISGQHWVRIGYYDGWASLMICMRKMLSEPWFWLFLIKGVTKTWLKEKYYSEVFIPLPDFISVYLFLINFSKRNIPIRTAVQHVIYKPF